MAVEMNILREDAGTQLPGLPNIFELLDLFSRSFHKNTGKF